MIIISIVDRFDIMITHCGVMAGIGYPVHWRHGGQGLARAITRIVKPVGSTLEH